MHTKTSSVALLIAAITAVTACHKNNTPSGPISGPLPRVTILYTTNDTLEYINGGTPTILGIHPNNSAYVNAMTVSGSNVYVSGGYMVGSDSLIGEIWNNGTASRLTDTAGNSVNIQTTAIFVDGTDVYTGGITYYPQQWTVPYTTLTAPYPVSGYVATWWKNGTAMNLPNPGYVGVVHGDAIRSHNDYVSGIAVSGNDVYVAGGCRTYLLNTPASYHFAQYWKNGIAADLPPVQPYDTTFNGTVANLTYTTGICVSGNDVYVCGTQNTAMGLPQPLYWKNGSPVQLGNTGATGSTAGIFVSGNNTYITGTLDSAFIGRAVYWKNGVPTVLSSNPSKGNAVAVSGNDVYVAGYETINNVSYATWWHNGVATHLGSGGAAYGISIH